MKNFWIYLFKKHNDCLVTQGLQNTNEVNWH